MIATLLLAASLSGAGSPLLPRIPIDEPAAMAPAAPAPARRGRPAMSTGTTAIGNVRVNDPAQVAAGQNDYTPAIAVNGDQVMVVWRVIGAQPTQRLRVAYSENGGASFTDAGWMPALPGNWRWGVDPCVQVDPIDGTFMVLAQVVDPAIPANGVGVISGRINGGIQWNAAGNMPFVTGNVGSYFAEGLDAHFDATNRTLHVAFKDAYVIPERLMHRYSADHGATWFPADTLVTNPNTSLLRGYAPRVAFNGNAGPLVTYVDGTDWTSQTISAARFEWPSFQTTQVDVHPGAFAGLPGSPFEFATYPSLAVDRSIYRFADRVYLAWVQSAAPTPTPDAGALVETEPDDTPPTAHGLAGVGHVSASMTSSTDVDVYSIPLLAQQHVVIVPEAMGAVGANANLRFEFLAPDGVHSLGYFSGVTPADIGAARALFTAPRAATYYLRVTNFDVGSYTFSVGRSSLGFYPASDRRDIVMSRSDTRGASWTTPAQVYVSPPGFDVGPIELVVGNDGRPYLFWADFSEGDPDGEWMTLRTTRSNDGGVTWEAPRTISTTATDWQALPASVTKIGYRFGAATTPVVLGELSPAARPARAERTTSADSTNVMHVAWADGRDGDGNIYTAHFPTGFDELFVCNDTTAAPGEWVGLRMVLRNSNTLYPCQITPTFEACQRNWSSIMAPFSLNPGETRSFWPVVVQVPDTAAAGTVFYQASIDLGPTSYGINTFIHVVAPTGVGSGGSATLAFAPPGPNPARDVAEFHFALPAEGPVSLEIYDVRGAHVRTVESGRLPAGAHATRWKLDDDGGRAVGAGVYLARLTFGDRSLVRRIAVVR